MSLPAAGPGHAGSNGPAIATICIGVVCLVANDAIAKWMTAYYAPLQIIFLRNLLALPMLAALLLCIGGRSALWSRRLRVHALRGFILVLAAYAFFHGLRVLPLAEATSLIFAAPLFVTAISVPLLGEQVGWRRWLAVIVGFLGVLIIVRPGAAAFQLASLFVIATALLYALFMISARWIHREDSFWTMMFYVTLFPILFCFPLVVVQWQAVDIAHLPHLLGMAIFGTLGVTLIGNAFRLAPAAVVAPFDYTALLWASLLGWLVWGEVPDIWTYVGAAVIMVSGISIVIRETRGTSTEAAEGR